MFVIILVMILGAAGGYLYLAQKLDNQRKQILVLSKQNEVLKQNVPKGPRAYGSISIRYSSPAYTQGVTKENCKIYIAPLEDSPIILKIERPTSVNVLFKGDVLNSTWYEISIPIKSSTNSKGWIKDSEILFNTSTASIENSNG